MKFRDPLPNNNAWLEVASARERAAYAEADRRAREARDKMLGIKTEASTPAPQAPATSTKEIDFWRLPSPRIAIPSQKSRLSLSQKSGDRQGQTRKKMGRPRLDLPDALQDLRVRMLELKAQKPDLTMTDMAKCAAKIMGWSRATAFRRLKELNLQGGSTVSEVP